MSVSTKVFGTMTSGARSAATTGDLAAEHAAHKRKLSREEQHATAYYSRGPYAAHSALTCAVVKGPDDFHQTTVTILGGHRLAELLNHVDDVVNQFTSDVITTNPHHDVKEIVAAAVARSLGWRIELPSDRAERIASDAEIAARTQPKETK